jgi:ADYC domain-containing protein
MMRTSLYLVTCASAACATPTEPDVGVALRCNIEWVCGSNSPEIDHYGFHELAVDGSKNPQGLAIVEFRLAGRVYEVAVQNGRLRAYDPASGAIQEGRSLIGGELAVIGPANTYAIRIADVGGAFFVVPPVDSIETYKLEWSVWGNPEYVPLCNAPPDSSVDPWIAEEWQPYASRSKMDPTHSVLFEGDRYDAVRKTIDPNIQPAWFNIGCAGHTLAKLYLTHHTSVAATAPSEERQAALKMLTADYCGTGTAYTVAGVPLVWQSGNGMDFFARPVSLEARWGPMGALCLDTPRVEVTAYTFAQKVFPNVRKTIAGECVLDPCKDTKPRLGSEPVVSANP